MHTYVHYKTQPLHTRGKFEACPQNFEDTSLRKVVCESGKNACCLHRPKLTYLFYRSNYHMCVGFLWGEAWVLVLGYSQPKSLKHDARMTHTYLRPLVVGTLLYRTAPLCRCIPH